MSIRGLLDQGDFAKVIPGVKETQPTLHAAFLHQDFDLAALDHIEVAAKLALLDDILAGPVALLVQDPGQHPPGFLAQLGE